MGGSTEMGQVEVRKDVLKGDGERVRIFSYLPNPRLFKATIAARYSGAEIEIVGAESGGLTEVLWDYEARGLTDPEKKDNPQWARTASRGFRGSLYKTDEFLTAHPYGNVPAAFAGEGRVGVFESNSIMRAAARAGQKSPGLYGRGWEQQSRIDGFLDRTLLFADAIQAYVLTRPDDLGAEMHARMASALDAYMTGIEAALCVSSFVASDELTLADIVFVCELALLTNEHGLREAHARLGEESVLSRMSNFPAAVAHLKKLSLEPHFVADLEKYFSRFAKHGWWSDERPR